MQVGQAFVHRLVCEIIDTVYNNIDDMFLIDYLWSWFRLPFASGESGQGSGKTITEETVRQIAREEIHQVIWSCGQEITYAVLCGSVDTLFSYYWWRKKRGTPLQDYIIRRGGGVVGSMVGCVTSRVIGHMIVFRIASWVIPRPLLGGVQTVIVLVGGGLMLILADGLLTLLGALGGDWLGAIVASKLHRVVAGYLNEPHGA